ncbi:MAG TPA: hypothetical protein VGO93_04335 [Candidatus Xenobia bacterium]
MSLRPIHLTVQHSLRGVPAASPRSIGEQIRRGLLTLLGVVTVLLVGSLLLMAYGGPAPREHSAS